MVSRLKIDENALNASDYPKTVVSENSSGKWPEKGVVSLTNNRLEKEMERCVKQRTVQKVFRLQRM